MPERSLGGGGFEISPARKQSKTTPPHLNSLLAHSSSGSHIPCTHTNYGYPGGIKPTRPMGVTVTWGAMVIASCANRLCTEVKPVAEPRLEPEKKSHTFWNLSQNRSRPLASSACYFAATLSLLHRHVFLRSVVRSAKKAPSQQGIVHVIHPHPMFTTHDPCIGVLCSSLLGCFAGVISHKLCILILT